MTVKEKDYVDTSEEDREYEEMLKAQGILHFLTQVTDVDGDRIIAAKTNCIIPYSVRELFCADYMTTVFL